MPCPTKPVPPVTKITFFSALIFTTSSVRKSKYNNINSNNKKEIKFKYFSILFIGYTSKKKNSILQIKWV